LFECFLLNLDLNFIPPPEAEDDIKYLTAN